MFKQTKNTDLNNLKLNGKVKSVLKKYYPARDFLGKIVLDKESKDFYPNDFSLLEFDSNGNQTRYKIEDSSGNSEEQYYEYDNKGNKTKIIESGNSWYNDEESILLYDEKNKLIKREVSKDGFTTSFMYYYNDKGYLSEMKNYDVNGYLNRVWIFQYDNNGNQTKMFEYNSDGYLQRINTFKYDNNNRRIEDIEYDNENNINNKNTFKYDSSGNKIEEINYFSADEVMQKHLMEYDNQGHLIKLNMQDFVKNIHKELKYKYEFDKNNNWIKKYEFQNHVPISLNERTIDYYNDY